MASRAAGPQRGGAAGLERGHGVVIAPRQVELELIDRRHGRRGDVQRDARAAHARARIVRRAADEQDRDERGLHLHPALEQWTIGSVVSSWRVTPYAMPAPVLA